MLKVKITFLVTITCKQYSPNYLMDNIPKVFKNNIQLRIIVKK